jgi:thymidylate synthase (FAD)
MGTVTIHPATTMEPIALMGEMAGICWGANTSDSEKNYLRGLDCLESQHGRVSEYPQVYIVLEGYSAKVIRELYTHIGGSPTRLQASTRYIEYGNFEYVTPPKLYENQAALEIYDKCMNCISEAVKDLEAIGIAKEDASMLLPLGMTTKVVIRTNLRNLIDMSHQRKCQRAFWEFRDLFDDIETALSDYSTQWQYCVTKYFVPKCKYLGYCPEKYSCKNS